MPTRIANCPSTLIFCLPVCAALLTALSASAATVSGPDFVERRGGPIAQSFLDTHGNNVSLLATGNGVSCVASQPLQVADSLYLAPDGTVVPFADVTRSPASSIQAIARPDAPVAFRIQLKYSPDPTKPIVMDIDDRTLDLAPALEASSDSLWLTGEAAMTLADAFGRGVIPVLRATSDGPGRQVADQITTPDMAGLEACLVTLAELTSAEDLPMTELSTPDVPNLNLSNLDDSSAGGLADIVQDDGGTLAVVETESLEATLPFPFAGLRLEFVARPDPETRVEPSVLANCRMRDIPENVFLGRLTAVAGFFAQTQDVYVAFDDEGQLQRAYIPGIFDSDLTNNSARVSLAADSNLPDQPNTVRGCLGDAMLEAPVCAFSDDEDGSYIMAECGVLGMSEMREDFLSFDEGESFMISTTSSTSDRSVTSGPGGGTTFSSGGIGNPVGSITSPIGGGGPFGSPGRGITESSTSDGGSDPVPATPPVVPLPTPFLLLAGAIFGLYGLGLKRRRQRHA